jgi:aspartate/methionine/tyrosine aminotransferase
MVKEFRARRDLVMKELAQIDGVSTYRPNGAFYVFPKVKTTMDSATLAERILKETSVAVTPGSAFGAAGEGHLRISYAASRETITEGVRRIGKVLEGI